MGGRLFDSVFHPLPMTEDTLTQHLIDMLAGGHLQIADDNTFFFHDAASTLPFATIVTKDSPQDNRSRLDRTGVFRLNIAVGKQRFDVLFGEAPAAFDPAAHDVLMPHPVQPEQAGTHWVSVINPSAKTFEAVKPLLAEALRRARSPESVDSPDGPSKLHNGANAS